MHNSLKLFGLFSLAASSMLLLALSNPAQAQTGIKLMSAVDGCKERRHFVDVSNFSHNGRYENPRLDVTCDDDFITVRTNSIINYEYVQITPTDLAVRNKTYRIPRKPRLAAGERQRVPLLGPIGVAVNGIPIFSANESPRHGWGDPMPRGILDFCNGHTARGFYHYHARPNCLVVDKNGSVGQVLGYAFDGYPIVSPFICMARNCKAKIKLRSSYRLIDGAPNANAWQANRYEPGYGDLDACNGKKLPGGGYAYFFTERFPYSLACYAGEPQLEGNANTRAPRDTSARGNRRGGPGGGPRGERRRGGPGGPGGFGPPRRGGGRPDFATLGGRPGEGGRIEPDDGGRAGLKNLADILNGEGGN